MTDRPNIKGLTFAEVEARIRALGGEKAGATLGARVYKGILQDGFRTFGEIPGMAKERAAIADALFSTTSLEVLSVRRSWDRSAKYAFKLADGNVIESVLLHHHGLWTVCVSSQAGCPLACRFCATGMLGLKRNLEAWEIVDQVVFVARDAGVRVSDIVFMGMGEPLLNEEAVARAAEVMTSTPGLQISKKRIVVSTSGVVPAIHRWIDAGRPWKLVFSLGSAVPEKRLKLMPIQERFGFDAFLDAVKRYERHRGGKHVTLEYVAIRNLTMGDDDIEAMRTHLRGFNLILNVIPLNPVGNELEAPSMEEARAFTAKLRGLGFPVKVRYSGGKDQFAGCGQLGRSLIEAGTPPK